MNRYAYLLMVLKSYSENLLHIDNRQKDHLFYLLLSYSLEFVNGIRGSYLNYDKQSGLLYNKVTIVYKKNNPFYIDTEQKLKHVVIDIDKDFRKVFISENNMIVLNHVKKEPTYSTILDNKLGTHISHVVLYPIFFQNDFIGLIEITRDKNREIFKDSDLKYLSILFNFSLSLLSSIYLFEWATRDCLTDCYAMTYFNKLLDRCIVNFERYKKPFLLFMIDIDNFKKINDTYGHLVGDNAIIHVVKAVESILREDIDFIARYGGDEFCTIINNCNCQEGERIAIRILEILSQKPLVVDDKEIFLSISIGIAQFDLHGQDRNTLYKNADCALYYSKKNGKNRYTIYTESMNN